MDKSIKGNLCKGLRACGIPKLQTHQILNIVEKWYDSSGPDWTVARIKALKQWYETYLTGKPEAPDWFRRSKSKLPLGIWRWVFNLPTAKALAVLSCGTVFYEKTVSGAQKEKFLKGLSGGNPNYEVISSLERRVNQLRSEMGGTGPWDSFVPPDLREHGLREIPLPTLFDMNGSIPIMGGHKLVRPECRLGDALKALELSWDSIPQVTFDFLDSQNLLGFMPMKVLGNEYQLELDRKRSSTVGRIGVIQEPELKARIVANPNRVTQVTLDPLKDLYMRTARKLPSDCTHNQKEGVEWVQAHLKQGIELAGSDMTSASDLLDLESCLKLVDAVYGFNTIPSYPEFRQYFIEVSKSEWVCPWLPELGGHVHWNHGDPLGTGPSFGLLTLTNNAAGFVAVLHTPELRGNGNIVPTDYFRVIGDDIIMDARIEPVYTRVIEALGGEINHSKTLKSDRVAEFAGHVITPNQDFLKRIKYLEPSDNSFMSYVSQLGDQAKYMLRPKQRQVYDLFKEVPGVAVDGPWMQDSYGVKLSERYQWYLEEVLPVLDREDPDLILTDYDLVLLEAKLSLEESGKTSDMDLIDPYLDDSGYRPEQVTKSFKSNGDPRLTNGKTLLDALYEHVERGSITPFSLWRKQQISQTSSLEEQFEDSDQCEISQSQLEDDGLDR
jgi:hypothetical protein